jgi:hypothetical protein
MKYFLKIKDQEEKEVTQKEYIHAERLSGFRPKGNDDGQPATGGFYSSRTEINGKVKYEEGIDY